VDFVAGIGLDSAARER